MNLLNKEGQEVNEEEVKETEEVVEQQEKKEEVKETVNYQEIAEARLKEIERLKSEKRNTRNFNSLSDDKPESFTKAEVRVFESLRDDAFQEFLEVNPQYKDNDELWGKFLDEYQDRVSELTFAQKKKMPVTKRLFKERLESVHKSIGGSLSNPKEEGKKELLQAQSAAQIMGAASGTGEQVDLGKQPERQRLLPKKGNGFADWVKPKK